MGIPSITMKTKYGIRNATKNVQKRMNVLLNTLVNKCWLGIKEWPMQPIDWSLWGKGFFYISAMHAVLMQIVLS